MIDLRDGEALPEAARQRAGGAAEPVGEAEPRRGAPTSVRHSVSGTAVDRPCVAQALATP